MTPKPKQKRQKIEKMPHVHSYVKLNNYFGWVCYCGHKRSVFKLIEEAKKELCYDSRFFIDLLRLKPEH